MSTPAITSERVTTLELFFDLVFVFTITQVAEVVVHHPDLTGIGHAVLQLAVLGWMFGGYAWLTNAAPATAVWPRYILLGAMAAFFVCALAVPHAFGADGIVFGVSYLAVVVLHAWGLLLGATPMAAVLRLARFNLASAALILGAGFVTGPLDWALWGGAILFQMLTPLWSKANRGFHVAAMHFAERHGLMMLIVMGESLISVGLAATASAAHATPALLLGALAGLAAAVAMWWAYFVREDERAAHAFEQAGERQRVNQGLLGYGLAHLIMIFGIIFVAAATKISLRELLSPMPMFGAWLMAAGCALYLIGGATFRWALQYASPLPRLGGAVFSVVVAPAGLFGSPAAALAAATMVIAATLGAERLIDRSGLELVEQ